MKTNFISFLLLTTICLACKPTTNNNPLPKTDTLVTKTDTPKTEVDTSGKTQVKYPTLRDVSKWTMKDFIVSPPYKSSKVVQNTLSYTVKEWEKVPNPFIATYQGCDFGDYFHMNFIDSNGTNYDFAYGKNNFGKYMLYDHKKDKDNPAYVGKTFIIYWNWEISTFPCCEGDYDPVEAYLPSITLLELVETSTSKK